MVKIFQSDFGTIFHCISLIITIALGQKEMVAFKFQILWKKFDVSKDHIFEFRTIKCEMRECYCRYSHRYKFWYQFLYIVIISSIIYLI